MNRELSTAAEAVTTIPDLHFGTQMKTELRELYKPTEDECNTRGDSGWARRQQQGHSRENGAATTSCDS